MDDRTPLLLTIVAAGLFVLAIMVFQPYSADWPGTAYAKPARQYIRAALRQDSMKLVRLSASDRAVTWALGVARAHPESLALWSGRSEAWTGPRSGDTTEVVLYPSSETCSEAPIVFRFVGAGPNARVLSARSACLDDAN